jgi:hypothetical protein
VYNEYIAFIEEWRGGRGGTYYYIREENILRRLEHYTVEVVRGKELVKYVVPFKRISNKTIMYLFIW